jgi:hypothetical protein
VETRAWGHGCRWDRAPLGEQGPRRRSPTPVRRGLNPCRDWSFGPRKGTAGESIRAKNRPIRLLVTKVQSRSFSGWDWGLERD